MTAERYYFGQGRLYSRDSAMAGRKGWVWWGDVSALTFEPSLETVRHRESYSGNRATTRKFDFLSDCTIKGTLHQIDAAGLARLLNGTVTEIAGGAVVSEDLGTVVVGDVIRLDHPGISDLIVKDSATPTPATIYDAATPNGTFDVSTDFGGLECLSLPTAPAPTPPLLASYTYVPVRQLAFLNKIPDTLQLKYEGINLAEGGAPVIVEFYRVSTALLQTLSLITSGTDVAGTDFSLEALLDSSKPASGDLGQFGRLLEVTA